jgi:hypothetical protein
MYQWPTNWQLRQDIWGSGYIDVLCLDLGAKCREVVSFKFWSLCSQGKRGRFLLDLRQDKPQGRLGWYGEARIFYRIGTREVPPQWRMRYSGMLRRVALVRTDVSDEHNASIIKVTRNVFLRNVGRLSVTANVVPSSPFLVALRMEALRSSEKLVLTRATQRNISEDVIFHSHRSENLNSFYRIDWKITILNVFSVTKASWHWHNLISARIK